MRVEYYECRHCKMRFDDAETCDDHEAKCLKELHEAARKTIEQDIIGRIKFAPEEP
jgi:hypothetical protein